MYINFFKYISYLFHLAIIITCYLGTIKNMSVLLLQFIVILSWKLNNNQCLLTQLEDKLFNETIIDIYFSFQQKYKPKTRNFIVPILQRRILYVIFIISCLNYLK